MLRESGARLRTRDIRQQEEILGRWDAMLCDRPAYLLGSEFLDAFALKRVRAERANYRDVDAILPMTSAAGAMNACTLIPIQPFEKVMAETFKALRRQRVDWERNVVRRYDSVTCVSRSFEQGPLVSRQHRGEKWDFLVPRAREPALPSTDRLLADPKAARELSLLPDACSSTQTRQEPCERLVSRWTQSVTH
jgi:hypothetical protein